MLADNNKISIDICQILIIFNKKCVFCTDYWHSTACASFGEELSIAVDAQVCVVFSIVLFVGEPFGAIGAFEALSVYRRSAMI